MAQYDHLSSDSFWNLVYETAKNKRSRKKVWRELMSPEYADVVRDMAETHYKRIDKNVLDLVSNRGAEYTDSDIVTQLKARDFIKAIYNSAVSSLEHHVAENKNVRKYQRIQTLVEYSEYLKDTIEDLREYVPDAEMNFTLYPSIEAFTAEPDETQIDEWLDARKARRDAK